MRLEDKMVVDTGGTHGLGEADVKLFAKEGAKVVIANVLMDQGRAVARSLRDAGHDVVFSAVDVTSDSDWQTLMELTLKTYSKLDVLANNAGISASAVEDLAEIEGWHHLMAVSSTSIFIGSRRAADIMVKAGRGSIVNIASIMGLVGHTTGHLGYYAAKASVPNQKKALAVRLGPHGVRVNSILPGFFPQMLSGKAASNVRDEVVKQVPMGRRGAAENRLWRAVPRVRRIFLYDRSRTRHRWRLYGTVTSASQVATPWRATSKQAWRPTRRCPERR